LVDRQDAYPTLVDRQDAYPTLVDRQDAYPTLVDRQDAYPTLVDRQDAYPTLVDRQDAYPTLVDRQDAYPTFFPDGPHLSFGQFFRSIDRRTANRSQLPVSKSAKYREIRREPCELHPVHTAVVEGFDLFSEFVGLNSDCTH
jgi:hypothetical protein